MRVTRLDSRSVMLFALVLGGCVLLLDLVVIVMLWIALSIMGIFSALGVGLGLGSVLGIALLVGGAHAAITAVMAWLIATAFNLTAAWTGGIEIGVAEDEPLVLPDAGFGRVPRAGVTSPSRSTVDVEHEGL